MRDTFNLLSRSPFSCSLPLKLVKQDDMNMMCWCGHAFSRGMQQFLNGPCFVVADRHVYGAFSLVLRDTGDMTGVTG